MRSRDGSQGWDDDTITEDIQALIDKAQDFTARGDCPNAIVILDAITESCVANWDHVGDDGVDSDEVVAALDQAWAEAILSTELSTAENTQHHELLDRVIVLNEAHLRRLMKSYLEHYHTVRPHLSLDRNAPIPRAIQGLCESPVVSMPYVGGLYQGYCWAI